MKRHIAVIASSIAIATGSIVGFYFLPEKKTDTTITPAAYADAKSCARCHASEAANYATTGMARAFYRPDEKLQSMPQQKIDSSFTQCPAPF
jgi:hypothetical protein